MGELVLITDPKVEKVFSNYSDMVRSKLQLLRALVIQTAEETEGVDRLEETLKWGGAEFCNQEWKYLADGLERKIARSVCHVLPMHQSSGTDLQNGLWQYIPV